MCYTFLECLEQQIPGASKTPGITTYDFKVNRFIGLSGIILLTSFNKSVVKWHDFKITLS